MPTPRLCPIDEDHLLPEVAAAIRRAQQDGALTSTVLSRIWAHRPVLAQAQIALHSRFYDSSIVPSRVLELVRLRIASINQCRVCQTSRKSDDVSEDDITCLADNDERFTPAEQAAIAFGSALAADHLSIGPDDIRRLRDNFTVEQAVEIAMFSALMVGSGRLAYALQAFDG